MMKNEKLVSILAEQYGIKNEKQLEEALKKQGMLDISLFVTKK